MIPLLKLRSVGMYLKKTRHAGNKQTMRVRINSFIVDKYSASNFSHTYIHDNLVVDVILKSIDGSLDIFLYLLKSYILYSVLF